MGMTEDERQMQLAMAASMMGDAPQSNDNTA